MKLRHVVLYPSDYRMEVFVEDPDGKARLVTVTWHAKVRLPTPPENWWDLVVGEVELSRAAELAKRQGRGLL